MEDPEGIWRGWTIHQVGILSFVTRQSFRAMSLRYSRWMSKFICIFILLVGYGILVLILHPNVIFQFDYLKSLEIEEKINKIRWCQTANGALFLLSTNDKTIKFWKVRKKILN